MRSLSVILALVLFCTGSLIADIPPDLHPTMQYTAGWFGNSLNNVTPIAKNGVVTDTYYEYVQKDGNALAVGPDGICYVTAGWDETQRGLGFYKNGHDAGRCQNISSAGAAVAVDDKYVYTCLPKPGGSGITIVRWNLDGSPASVPIPPTITGYPGGLLAANHKVYVGDTGANMVSVFDRDTFQPLQKFPVYAPWRMTCDKDGKLWIINRKAGDPKGGWYTSEDPNSTAQVSQYDPVTGQPTGKNIPNMGGVTAVAMTPDNTLVVAGPNSQVLEFDILGAQPVQSGSLGAKGGVYSDPPGVMGPDRLFGLWGVGCDKAGNIYTLGRLPNEATGIDLRSFTKDGKMNWQLYNVEFTGICGVDPASDGLDVYTAATHFHLDPTKPPGQQAEWKGYTLSTAYDDGRFTQGWNSPMMRRLDGRLYMYTNPGHYLGVFRQGPGETFIPSGLIDTAESWLFGATTGDHAHELDWPPQQPLAPGPPAHPGDKTPGPPIKMRWSWHDENGDGKIQPSEIKPDQALQIGYISASWVDNKGDIWMCGDHTKIWHLPMLGFDAHQNPIYDSTKQILPKAPPDLGEILRIQYDSDTDTMYLSGNPPTFQGKIFGGALGVQIIRYDHWSTNPTVKWKISVPQSDSDQHFPAFYVAGERVFIMQRFMSRIWVYNSNDGTFVGTITTTPKTGSSGWCDQTYGIQAFERKDGSYCVFAEDDYRPKIRFYYVPPQPQPSPPLPLPSVSNP